MRYPYHRRMNSGRLMLTGAFLIAMLLPLEALAASWSFTWRQGGQSGKHSFTSQGACQNARSTWINTMRKLGERASAGPCVSSGGSTPPPSATGPGPAELERQRQRQEAARRAREAEERRKEAEQKRELEAEKKDALEALKGVPSGATTPNPKLKDPFAPKQPASLAVVIAAEQRLLDAIDPAWIEDIQNRSSASIRARRGKVHQLTRSFKMNAPPRLVSQPKLNQSEPGDIILVGADRSSLAGAAQGFVQRYAERNFFGNEAAPVTHVLVYIGTRAGSKLFLDNQLGEGPRIIGETEFRQRYGLRPLFRARPINGPEANDLFSAAYDFAKSNKQATRRGTGLLGTKYGIFGKDNVVCSEAALFSVVEAQAPGQKIVTETVGGKRILNPISVTPGDIYNQDGKGFFTVQPLHVD